MKRSIVYSIILIFIATFALAANYTIHDFGTGVMHDAKDIYVACRASCPRICRAG